LKRTEKEALVNVLNERFSKAETAVLTDFRGLDTAAMNDLRRQLREASVEYRVVKNTLLARAAEGTDVALLKDHLSGPTAVALSFDDPVAPARVLVKFSEKHDQLEVKAGVLKGKVVDAAGVKALAKLPSREALLGQLLSVMNGPARAFVTVLSAMPRDFVGVLSAIKDKKEKEAA
jgi:large subunit ribosomal protein L10